MNLLSIGAAYGVMVAVFSWGWGRELFGLDQTVPISSWVPILMFAVAFGLSMDYEVFLLSRVREEWLRTGDPRGSVVDETALTRALVEGRLGGAGLDVFEEEPRTPRELWGLDNVVLQPHQGSATVETRRAMADTVLANLDAWLAGKAPPNPVSV